MNAPFFVYLSSGSRTKASLLALVVLVLVGVVGCDAFGNTDSGGGEQKKGEPPPYTISGEPPELMGKLVFAAKTGDPQGYQIFTMNVDGTGRKQLTFDLDSTDMQEEAYSPSWSPDGERIAFVTSRRATTAGASLYLMDADGSNVRPLKRFERGGRPRVLSGSRPVWSPDGKKIAYYVCTSCEPGGRGYDIVTVDVAGEDYDPEVHHSVTDHPAAADLFPTWSPDGKQIAFVSNRAYLQSDDPFRQDLYVVNADGSNLKRLTVTGKAGPPSWSPDGKKIAFAWRIQDADVFLYDLASRKAKKLADLKYISRPKWFPGSEYLLVAATTHQGRKVLQTLDVNGKVHSTVMRRKIADYDWFVNSG